MASLYWSSQLTKLMDKLQQIHGDFYTQCNYFLKYDEGNGQSKYSKQGWLEMEKQVIAQMSIDRLHRQIAITKQRLSHKNNKLNQRLRDISRELKFMKNRCLKGKFIIDRHQNVLSLIKKKVFLNKKMNQGKQAVVPMTNILMSERYAKKMIDMIYDDYATIKQEAKTLTDLRQQLQRCKTYMALQLSLL